MFLQDGYNSHIFFNVYNVDGPRPSHDFTDMYVLKFFLERYNVHMVK